MRGAFRIHPLVLLIGGLCAANISLAATINAANCSQSTVQAAINSAVDGDTVTVPAGTCTWSGPVSISKTITLRGAGSGAGGTKITHGGGDYSLISIDVGSKTGKMDVSGFWFFGSSSNWNGTAMSLSGPSGWKNLRVHHNVFEDNYPWTMTVDAGTHGLIDSNTFTGRAHGIKFYGEGASDWSKSLVLGSPDFFFVESNTFNMDDWYGVTGTTAVDMFGGGRVVFRYNTGKYYYFGTHDKARSGLVSANAYEVYKNTFWTNSNKWKAVDITAGTGVVWENTITGDWSVPVGAMDYKTFDPRSVKRCDGTDPADQNTSGQSGWRCQYQIGSMGEGKTAYGYPLYTWSNTKNGSLVGMQCTDGCSHVQSGRDFINNGSTPKPGYTPYAYPHPLTESGASIQLSPPTNLRFQ